MLKILDDVVKVLETHTNTPGKKYQSIQTHQVKIIMKFTNTPGKNYHEAYKHVR